MVWLGLTLLAVGFVVLAARFRRIRRRRRNMGSSWRTFGIPLTMTSGPMRVNPRNATWRAVIIATLDNSVMRHGPRRNVASLKRDNLADENWGVARS